MGISEFLNIPGVMPTIIAGGTWLVNKILGRRADTKAGKATQAALASAAIMGQMILTEPNKTVDEMKTAFKGVIAIQFANAGFTEVQRKPWQPLIDATIAKALERWAALHPAPATVTMPVWSKLPRV